MRKSLFFVVFFMLSLQTFSQSDVYAVARTGTVEELKGVMKNDPDIINRANPDGNSPLILACYKGNTEVAKYLAKNVKDVNFASPMGTALMAATVKNNAELIKYLLENKANPNITDANGSTALIYASIFKYYDIAELLVKYKSDEMHKDNRGNSAFDYAILANDDKLVQILKTK